MQIAVRVQAHPSRAQLRAALLESLSPLPVEVVEHSSEPPDPWLGYRACLSDLPDCSHVLIVQDDALPCKNFVPALEQIAESIPKFPVCLFLGGVPASTAAQARRAMIRKQRYTNLLNTPFVPLVAVLWPKAKAQEFLNWSQGQQRLTRADDGNAGRWMIRTKQHILVSVPSLVEHNDYIESVKGGRPTTWGKDKGRVAALLAEDGLAYKW